MFVDFLLPTASLDLLKDLSYPRIRKTWLLELLILSHLQYIITRPDSQIRSFHGLRRRDADSLHHPLFTSLRSITHLRRSIAQAPTQVSRTRGRRRRTRRGNKSKTSFNFNSFFWIFGLGCLYGQFWFWFSFGWILIYRFFLIFFFFFFCLSLSHSHCHSHCHCHWISCALAILIYRRFIMTFLMGSPDFWINQHFFHYSCLFQFFVLFLYLTLSYLFMASRPEEGEWLPP